MKMVNQLNLTKELILLLFTFGVIFLLYSALADDYHRLLNVQAQLQQQQQQRHRYELSGF
jgi:hypothetical protein